MNCSICRKKGNNKSKYLSANIMLSTLVSLASMFPKRRPKSNPNNKSVRPSRKNNASAKTPTNTSPIAPHNFNRLPEELQNIIIQEIKKQNNNLYLMVHPEPAFHMYSMEKKINKMKDIISVIELQFGKVYSSDGIDTFHNTSLKNNKATDKFKKISVEDGVMTNNTVFRVSFTMNEWVNEPQTMRTNTVHYGHIENSYVVFFRTEQGTENFMKALQSKIREVNNIGRRFSIINNTKSIRKIKLYKNYAGNHMNNY